MNYKDCDLRKGLEFILQDLINEEDKSYITIENYQEKIVNWFDEKSDKNEEIEDLESEIDEMKSKLDNLKNKELTEGYDCENLCNWRMNNEKKN